MYVDSLSLAPSSLSRVCMLIPLFPDVSQLAETFSKYKGLVDKLNGGNAPVGHFGPAVSGAVWKGRGKGRSKTADDSPAPVAGPSNAQKGKGGKEKGAAGSSSTTPAKRQAASTGVVDNEDLKKKSKPSECLFWVASPIFPNRD